jgi:LPXTG-motif cell wall-anchored protein
MEHLDPGTDYDLYFMLEDASENRSDIAVFSFTTLSDNSAIIDFNDEDLLDELIYSGVDLNEDDKISMEEAANCSDLNLDDYSFSDITGLEYFYYLEYLDLEENYITDISALANMPLMEELYLNDNSITDIRALAGMQLLCTLDLSYNTITTIASLSGLSLLNCIYVDVNMLDISEGSSTMDIINAWIESGVEVDYEPQLLDLDIDYASGSPTISDVTDEGFTLTVAGGDGTTEAIESDLGDLYGYIGYYIEEHDEESGYFSDEDAYEWVWWDGDWEEMEYNEDSGNYECVVEVYWLDPETEYDVYTLVEAYDEDTGHDYVSVVKRVSTTTLESEAAVPVLTAGDVDRTSDTTATVTFTTDVGGEYFYEIVGDGDEAPEIDTTGEGTACDAEEITITDPEGLSSGAMDIYIIVKDADGNVSELLKMDIAAYATAPTVTFSTTGSNGSLAAKVDGEVIASGDTVSSGKNVVFTATPDTGYRVKNWTLGGTVVEEQTDNAYTLEDIAESSVVTVEFELIPAEDSLTDSEDYGSVEGLDGVTFESGTELTIEKVIANVNATDKASYNAGVKLLVDGKEIKEMYEIRLLLDGEPIQPDGFVKVKIKLTAEQKAMGGLQIIYVSDLGVVTIIQSSIEGDYLVFTTDHFSYYGLIAKSASPKTGDTGPAIPITGMVIAAGAIVLTRRRKGKTI